MVEYHFKLPISEEDVRKLRVGDIVYLTGIIVTARDKAHKKALETLEKGEKLPVSLEGLAVYHCGPLVRRDERGNWEIVVAGPTTSTRMEELESDFIEKTGVRLVIGKGGMGPKTARAAKEFGAAYTVFTGGAAVLAARAIKRIVDVYWLELGAPEAMWVLEVEDFGPLTVVIDSTGKNLYEDRMAKIREKIDKEILPKIS